MKPNSQSTQCWRIKLKKIKKSIKKGHNKWPESTCQNCDLGHKTKITPWKVN
jgi:hypothetical protein